MKAVILAAGFGSRMKSKVPKPLVRVFGLPLIEHKIRKLKGFDIGVVYNRKEIADYLRRKFPNVTLIYNPHPERENGYSLYCAKEFVGKERFVLLMADHYYGEKFYDLLSETEEGNFVFVSPFSHNGEEATKVKVNGNKVVGIGKSLKDYDFFDTGFFVLSPEVFEISEELAKRGKFTLNELMQRLASRGKLSFKLVNESWIDVDEPQEVKAAESLIRNSLKKDTDGPVSKFLNRKISTLVTPILLRFEILTPNVVTVLTTILGIVTAILFAGKHYVLGGILAQLTSILDGCDGEIARVKNLKSKFGGALDSVLDRYVDTLILFCLFLTIPMNKLNALAFFLAVTGSILVSYASHLTGKRPYFITRDVRLFIVFAFSVLFLVLKDTTIIYLLWVIGTLSHLGVLYTLLRLKKGG